MPANDGCALDVAAVADLLRTSALYVEADASTFEVGSITWAYIWSLERINASLTAFNSPILARVWRARRMRDCFFVNHGRRLRYFFLVSFMHYTFVE